MPQLDHGPSTASTLTTTKAPAGGNGSSASVAGGGGYNAQVQRLAPRESLPGITIGGVTLTAQATGATFAAMERALGNPKARAARGAAKKGGAAVLELFSPHIPAAYLKSQLAHDITNSYAKWTATQPEIKADPVAAKNPNGEGKGGGEGAVHNIDVKEHGLMVGLEAAIGAQLALLCPQPGRSAKANVKGACSVEEIYLGLELSAEATHTHEGKFEVGGSVKISIGLGDTKNNVALNETLSVGGHGDDAIEAMHMAGLAVEHFMRQQQFDWKNPTPQEVLRCGRKFLVNAVSLGGGGAGIVAAGALALAGAKIADALWGKNFEKDIIAQMDEGDYGEHSVGVGIGAQADEEEVEMEAGLDWEHKTKVSNVNGAIGSESEDSLTGHAKVAFANGGWKFGLSAELGGTFGGSHRAGFEVEISREDQLHAETAMVGDLLASNVRGLAQKVSKRAGPLLGKVADGMESFMKTAKALAALAGVGGLRLVGEFDSTKKELELVLVVTHTIEAKANEGIVDVEVEFETGEEVARGKVAIDLPL